MARFYSNENFAKDVVECLRTLGHDVLTSFEAGNANQQIDDREVLRFAASQSRAVITYNRRDFLRLHQQGIPHSGMILCTVDPRFVGQAERIHQAVANEADLADRVIRVYKPAS